MGFQDDNNGGQKPFLDRLLNGGAFVLGVFTGMELLVLTYIFFFGSNADYWKAFGNFLSALVPLSVIATIALVRGNSWKALLMME